MTVSTEINHEEYVGNGITYVFPYRFRIFKASNMAVVSVDVNGVEKNLVLNTDFTLSGVSAYTGGNVTLMNPLPSGWGLTLTRELPAIQETDLRNQGTFFAETHEDAFDYLTMLIQQVGSWFTLALRKPTFLSKFYDAKQNRIVNLADPVGMQDAVNNRSMRSYVEQMVAGVAGGFGWFLQTGVGAVFRTFQDKMRDSVNAKDYGLKADGVTNDTAALKRAISAAVLNKISEIKLPTGQIILTESIIIPAGISLIGEGIDYWDTYRPAPDRLLKSWDKGTHLVFVGTGAKTETIQNIMNARTPKIVDGISYPLTDFTNNDSIGGAPATPKLFSAAVKATHASQIKNLRIMLNNNGIDGYNDAASLSLGDNWDVGLWVFDGSAAIFDNIQVVGYWRIAGVLLTENDGTNSMVGNPESMTFNNVLTQGRRGLLIRNTAQIDVYSHTDTTVTALYNSSFTLTADMRFKISGSAQIYTFTGYTVSGATITLTGVTPNLPASVLVLRAANIGNNFSGTVFSNFKACSLDHTSGNNSAFFGLGEAGSMEIDGYPIRNLKFINFKAQTTFDRLNTIFGDMKDAKFISSEHENGVMIAYSNSETIGYTGNIRFINSDIQSSTNITAFTPRDCLIDYKQMPTQNTDGTFIIKNWRANNLNIQYADGATGILLRDSDKNAQLSNGSGLMYLRSAGGTNGLDLFGASFAVRDVSGTAFLQGFPSLNITGPGTLTMGSFAIGGAGAVRGATPNTAYCGDAAHPWAGGYTQTAFSITSNMLDKQDIKLFPDNVLDAWGNVDWYLYRLKDAVMLKGDEARHHAGLLAQEIMSIFQTYDIDAENLGLVIYKRWPESVEVIDGKEVVVPAGDSYSVRYTEALCIEAAFNRRERVRLEMRIEALEKVV